MAAYYNELDKYCAQWLRNLIAEGLIAAGDVDERSIKDVQSDDLKGYAQCHFFAGIGGWSAALRLAGWPDTRSVWTGSCPCQPFSVAGKRKGTSDERHLWPDFYRLIDAVRPPVVFGEQVASAAGSPIAKGKDVQKMLDQEVLNRVLLELKGTSSDLVQGMREDRRTYPQTQRSNENESGVLVVAQSETRICTCQCSEGSSTTQGDSIRSRPQTDSTENRQRRMRDDRYSVRPQNITSMERTLPRSNRSWCRIHDGEHTSGLICAQCDGQRMGTESDLGDCACDYGTPEAELERLIEGYRSTAEDAPIDWLAGVRNDLGRSGYAFGACVAPAASVGAPHIRQRLWWSADRVADFASDRRQQECPHPQWIAEGSGAEGRPAGSGLRGSLGDGLAVTNETDGELGASCDPRSGLAHSRPQQTRGRLPGPPESTRETREWPRDQSGGSGDFDEGLDNAADSRCTGERFSSAAAAPRDQAWLQEPAGRGAFDAWGECLLIPCLDGKLRRIPVESSFQPLVDGLQFRVGSGSPFEGKSRIGLLRAYGNAIVPGVAAEFIRAYQECRP